MVMMVVRSVGTVLLAGGSVVGRIELTGGIVVGRAVVGVQSLVHGFSTLIELSAFAAEVSVSKMMMVSGFIVAARGRREIRPPISCHKPTSTLFDDLVGASEQRSWHG